MTTNTLPTTELIERFIADIARHEASCKTRMKDSEALILHGMVGRFKSMPFKTTKQMASFRDALLERMNQHILAEAAKINHKKDKARMAKLERDRVQSEICARWAKTALKPMDLVKFRGVTRNYQVLKLEEHGIMVVEVKRSVTQSANVADTFFTPVGNATAFRYDELQKMYRDGEWQLVYNIASGL